MDKTSRRQSVRKTEEQKRDLIRQWQQSNLSIKTFCAEHDFSNSVFHSWLNKYERKKIASGDVDTFLPLKIDTTVSSSPTILAEIILPGGTRIQLY